LTKERIFFGKLVVTKHQEPGKTQMDYINLQPHQDINENGLIFNVASLYMYYQQSKDTRKVKGKQYPLALLLLLMTLAKLGGDDNPSGIADWVANRAEQLYELKVLPKTKVPCHMTYRRVLQTVKLSKEQFRLGKCEVCTC